MNLSRIKYLYPYSLLRGSRGFTLIELLVTTVVAGAVITASLGAINEQRRSFLSDRDRINVNDNLRVAMNLIGDDIQQSGELLENINLPTISTINGATASVPDRIILQRRKIPEVLTLCQDVSASASSIDVADAQNNPPCTAGSSVNVTKWQTERWNQDGKAGNDSSTKEKLWAYLYQPPSGSTTLENRGEFVRITAETKGSCNSTTYSDCWKLTLDVKPTKSYTKSVDFSTQPKLYVLEQREYRLSDDTNTSRTDDKVLELIVNGQTSSPLRISNLLGNLQFRVKTVSTTGTESWNDDFNLPTGTTVTNWQTVGGVEVTLNGLQENSNVSSLTTAQLTLKSQFLPRNVISQ